MTESTETTEQNATDANVGQQRVVRQRRSEIIKYIDALRLTDPYIRTIFTNGGCYRFALFLRHSYPDGKLITNFNFDHVRLLIDGRGYDIYGDVDFESSVVAWLDCWICKDIRPINFTA